ncbi:MAG TPA: hypothetical protein VNG33_15205 [Polyangiaceae bacterium]|nr:hypothetical protein [Polyangiaceae bacterium]
MLGLGKVGVALLGVCCCLGCGGSAASGEKSGASRLLSTTSAICQQLAKCYPELQSADTLDCNAPTSDGQRITYYDFGADAKQNSAITQCVDEYSDQAGIAAWVSCQIEANRVTFRCFDACPADGLMCVEAGTAAKCDAFIDEHVFNACVQAKL